MVVFACTCLNVKINPKEILGTEKASVSVLEENDLFFKQEFVIACVDIGSIKVEQPFLLQSNNIGQWITHQCLNCLTQTHAINREQGLGRMLITKRLQVDPSQIRTSTTMAGYSPMFRIILTLPIEKDEQLRALEASKDEALPPSTQAASRAIHIQMTQYIQDEEAKMEERIRIFSEQQHSTFLAMQDKARSDRRHLLRMLVNLEKQNIRPAEVESMKLTGGVAGISQQMPIRNIISSSSVLTNKLRSTLVNRRPIGMAYSLDTEGLFDMEDNKERQEVNDDPSDDEQDTDVSDSGSHDEGIHIPKPRHRIDMAQSLPVTIPVFGQTDSNGSPAEFPDYEDVDFNDPQDIAASMKALAQSVHGGDLFGDLPRPRLNTMR